MVRGGGAGSPLAMARSGAGVNPQHHVLNSFQQLLTQDMVGMNFSQLPGYGAPPNHHFAPYSLDPCQGVYPPLLGGSHKPEQEDLPPMHAMYGASVPMPGAFSYCPDMGGENLGGAKAEYAWPQGGQPQGGQMLGGYSQGPSVWEQSTRHMSASPRSAVEDESGGARSSAGGVAKNGYESSMLLNLGLNSWPAHHQQVQQVGKQQPTPAAWDPHQTHAAHQHHPVSTTTTTSAGTKPLQTTNGSSPPHGSSTIEEEGSTPTNGYSTSGYEEGDAVSSMWHDMHDMQDIFQ